MSGLDARWWDSKSKRKIGMVAGGRFPATAYRIITPGHSRRHGGNGWMTWNGKVCSGPVEAGMGCVTWVIRSSVQVRGIQPNWLKWRRRERWPGLRWTIFGTRWMRGPAGEGCCYNAILWSIGSPQGFLCSFKSGWTRLDLPESWEAGHAHGRMTPAKRCVLLTIEDRSVLLDWYGLRRFILYDVFSFSCYEEGYRP